MGGQGGGKHTQIKYLCHKNHLFPELNPNETSVEGPNLALSFLKVTASVSHQPFVCVSEPHIANKHFLNKEL